MIGNGHVSQVFAMHVCHFPAIQFDIQHLAPNLSEVLLRYLHQLED